MILILGGAGYIGSHVNKMLSRLGHETVVYDNLIHGHREFVKWGHFVCGDLADTEHLRQLFRTYPITSVMHFAAFAYVGESVVDPQKYYLNNLRNALNLLEAMLEANVSRIIFSSTCATYGNPQSIPITEDHPQYPINPYGQSKLMVEKVLRDYSNAYNLKYVALRYFNAAGADPDGEIGERHSPETHLIPLVLDAAAGLLSEVTVYGGDYPTRDGTCIRDYIHVCDLAKAHLLALDYLKAGGASDEFNLGIGRGFSVREVIDCARQVTGRDIPAAVRDRRPGDPEILVGCADKAGKVLSWKPDYRDLPSIMQTAWDWHMKEQKR